MNRRRRWSFTAVSRAMARTLLTVCWLAGGGVRGGLNFGATYELGYAAVQDVVTVHDLHATMLHLLGIDHERFSVKFQGLDAKLSGVEGAQVLKGILS